jgi:hypothetical protein
LDSTQTKAKIIKRGTGETKVDMVYSDSQQGGNLLALYAMKCGKLVKFKDTRLEAIQYTQSGSRGKLLISFATED